MLRFALWGVRRTEKLIFSHISAMIRAPRVPSHNLPEKQIKTSTHFEFLSQFRVLCGDANWARVEVALPHHHAAQRNQRRRGHAHLISAEKTSDDDIFARAHLAVRLKTNPRPEAVQLQCLVSFSDAQLPRQACVLDAGPGGCASTAIVP